MRIATIAITTSSSTSVNARIRFLELRTPTSQRCRETENCTSRIPVGSSPTKNYPIGIQPESNHLRQIVIRRDLLVPAMFPRLPTINVVSESEVKREILGNVAVNLCRRNAIGSVHIKVQELRVAHGYEKQGLIATLACNRPGPLMPSARGVVAHSSGSVTNRAIAIVCGPLLLKFVERRLQITSPSRSTLSRISESSAKASYHFVLPLASVLASIE